MSRVPVRMVAQGASSTAKPIVARVSAPLEQTSDRASNQLQRNLAAATARARASVIANHTVLTALTFAAGEMKTLNHGLGAAYAGFFCIRALTNPPAIYEVALPAGVSTKTSIALKSVNAGTYDILVFA